MCTPEDMNANAEFVRMADEVVKVPGGSNNNNYANVNLICEIAERCHVDAVIPLWGHASEKPSFPTQLSKCKRKVTRRNYSHT
jgi:acetyl-CoA carboxylase/biotin carboxylase 1